ncbi:16S rRNA (cytosine967-C5)-methyltransferase [Sphingomonas gellani]|uniref:16S rRNA (Cytosine967-C5)-methyltransferase n=1 Tax=Sphingomonas gellani TaxID=1166340 RepID=A0A1H7ZUP0_9SPHN|nr:RsmB/NOP family class I SAM-dependent RNA methyltransferase [Sphingomonas gellani]SEM61288.1 16S rRNA (cytosine967-C5)-methyltransferase [Sphingomonas gellani]
MTPAARVQAAIELLDDIIAAASGGGAAADTLIGRYFAARRYAGSKDRRAVRELVYRAIRHSGEAPPSGRAVMVALADADPGLASSFDGSAHGPEPIIANEPRAVAGVVPAWLEKAMVRSGLSADAMAALVGRAPLDLRVNRLKAEREPLLREIEGAAAVPGLPNAMRLATGTAVEQLPMMVDGLAEIQDAGSQAVTLAVPAEPGAVIVDLCAGAGGKTLALAAAMEDWGRLIACDTDRARLSRLAPRAEGAGVSIAEIRLLDPNRETDRLTDLAGAADAVLVDAPCSGTGTWRRNPEARWRLNPARLERLVQTQRRLLDLAAMLVRPGGVLVHVVCSLLDEEGSDQVETFLAAHAGWAVEVPVLPLGRPHGHGVRMDPLNDDTDGFFVARLRAP